MFRSPRLAATSLLALTLALTGCQDDPAAPAAQSSDLQKAAEEAQAPARKQSHLIAKPGAGFLTPERINAAPSLAGKRIVGAKIAPSGEFATVLQGRADNPTQQDLWTYDLATGEGRLLVSSTDILGAPEELSAEEKNRRERARQYGSGIISYDWAGENLLLFPLGGDIYLYDLETNTSRQVTATKGFETDPKVSKDGTLAAYVRGNELFVKNLKTGLERQLSDGASETIRNATASFVVQEELGRATGYWLSDDASKLAYTQIDESPIATESRIEYGADGIDYVQRRYPFAGTDNATIKLGVVRASGGRTRWVDIGADKDIYLTRAAWAPDNQTLFAGILSRDHKTHKIYKINSRTGKSEVLFEETSPTWINIDSDFHPTVDGGLLITSEQGDKRQLFKIAADGSAVALTPDTLLTRDVLCLTDVSAFVSGWQDNPLARHIFKINFAANQPAEGAEIKAPLVTQITQADGQWGAKFNKDCTRFMGSFSSIETPPQLRAYEADGTPLSWLNQNELNDSHPYAEFLERHILPEFGQIPAEDGTMMDYMLFKPEGMKPSEKRASITIVYNGPGVQRVYNGWGRKQFARMLAHHGFVVFSLDGRGATNRGKAYEDVLYRAMGRAEVVDQSAGAKWLAQQNFIDPQRMGIYGWSYGGYMTLHMLGQTDLYASGVSGAPVTDWALYDTAYTERYLGSPMKDSANYTEGAYENGSVFSYLGGLTEPVLLMHGMADDNVVFRHSIKLMNEMQKNGQQNLRVMTYPGEKHGFRKTENRIHRDRQILEFFLETLDIKDE